MKTIATMGGIGLALALSAVNACAAEWHGRWGYRQRITLNTNSISGPLAHFPVLLTEANVGVSLWAHAQADGDDICFTDADGVTVLAHELEQYDPVRERLVAWVLSPLLSGDGSGCTLYLYYGRPTVGSQAHAADVWSDGFAGVWHLKEDMAGTAHVNLYLDSTANTNHGTDYVSATGKVGRIDGGQEFNGPASLDHINGGTSASLNLANNFTLEGWVYLYGGNMNQMMVGKMANDNTYLCYGLRINSNNGLNFTWYQGNTAYNAASANGIFSTGSWSHVAAVVGPTRVSLYKNGAVQTLSMDDPITSAFMQSTNALGIGAWKRPSPVNCILGRLDEIRVHTGVRPAAWIATCYSNQASPATFATHAAEETLPTKTMIILK